MSSTGNCPVCGGTVLDFVCTNETECGYILCPICDDGVSGGSSAAPSDERPDSCRHFLATIWHDDSLLMDGAPFVFTLPEDNLEELLDGAVERLGGYTLSSVFTGGSMGGNGTWTDYFVYDVEAARRLLQDTSSVKQDTAVASIPGEGDRAIVNAIREFREGDFDASEGLVEDGILIMLPVKRRTSCCGTPLELIAEAKYGETMTWGLWHCMRCDRTYSIGPKLPPTWVDALARACIALYEELRDETAKAFGEA